jgi:hypothetical protein
MYTGRLALCWLCMQLFKILCYSSHLVSGFLLQRHQFSPMVLHVWFVVGNVTLGNVFLQAPNIFIARYHCGTVL